MKDLIPSLMYTLLSQSIMQALKNFESSAVETLSLEPETGTVQVGFFSGDYTYYGVSKRAIQKLIDTPAQSIGAWVNNNCLRAEGVTYEYGFAS